MHTPLHHHHACCERLKAPSSACKRTREMSGTFKTFDDEMTFPKILIVIQPLLTKSFPKRTRLPKPLVDCLPPIREEWPPGSSWKFNDRITRSLNYCCRID